MPIWLNCWRGLTLDVVIIIDQAWICSMVHQKLKTKTYIYNFKNFIVSFKSCTVVQICKLILPPDIKFMTFRRLFENVLTFYSSWLLLQLCIVYAHLFWNCVFFGATIYLFNLLSVTFIERCKV